MVINEFINESTELGFFINQNAKNVVDPYLVRDVRQAGFAVLKGAKMPAILVELGYMTNDTDLNLITTQSFQDNLAEQIAKGLIDYEKSK